MVDKTGPTSGPTSKPAKTTRSRTKAVAKTPVAASRSASGTQKDTAVDAVPAGKADFVKKKELLERIAAATSLKKSEIRPVLDATLEVLGDLIREGKDIAAPPLGRIKYTKEKDTPNGKLAVLRVKLKDRDAVSTPKEEG